MGKKIIMPRSRERLEELLINTFIAGCNHGYAVEHTRCKDEQEMIGALAWIGRITQQEANERMEKIWSGEDGSA